METLELEKTITQNNIELQQNNLYDEDGYLIASFEEALAEYNAGLAISFKSKEDKMKYIMQGLDDV
ncbi:MAG: hypothetical protein FWG85_07425 [Bacteroidetes bacterium]|nr:hypothetical protein [Bacteroidota bacterium]